MVADFDCFQYFYFTACFLIEEGLFFVLGLFSAIVLSVYCVWAILLLPRILWPGLISSCSLVFRSWLSWPSAITSELPYFCASSYRRIKPTDSGLTHSLWSLFAIAAERVSGRKINVAASLALCIRRYFLILSSDSERMKRLRTGVPRRRWGWGIQFQSVLVNRTKYHRYKEMIR